MNTKKNNAYKPSEAKAERLWIRRGLIWRTLATYSEALGRTPCRSSSPRRHFQHVLLTIHPGDTHGHAAAAQKMLVKIGDNLFRCLFRRHIPRIAAPQKPHVQPRALLLYSFGCEAFILGSLHRGLLHSCEILVQQLTIRESTTGISRSCWNGSHRETIADRKLKSER
jgi:hypothetical protein